VDEVEDVADTAVVPDFFVPAPLFPIMFTAPLPAKTAVVQPNTITAAAIAITSFFTFFFIVYSPSSLSIYF
jgi:hypothetical protein